MIVDEAEPYLRSKGIDFDLAFLEKILPDVFRMAEFTGGLDLFRVAHLTLVRRVLTPKQS